MWRFGEVDIGLNTASGKVVAGGGPVGLRAPTESEIVFRLMRESICGMDALSVHQKLTSNFQTFCLEGVLSVRRRCI